MFDAEGDDEVSGRFPRIRARLAAALLLAPAAGAGVNNPPQAPIVREPATDGITLNPADVHMETAPFSDPDAGDQHACTDWEIWTTSPSERVWFTACATGLERLHAHLGDGAFENSHEGRSELAENTEFLLRVRHGDDSGDPATSWSPWSQRAFRTGEVYQVFPLDLDDVTAAPVPRWTTESGGSPVVLPPSTPPSSLRLESAAGALLLAIEPGDGTANQVTNPGPLLHHEPLRVRLTGGAGGLTLPATDLEFVGSDCTVHRVLLAPVQLGAGATRSAWISSAGATYEATDGQSQPVFDILARGLSPPWSPRRPGFRVETFAGGFQLPVGIAFVPSPGSDPDDPLLYVTELYGTIRVVLRDRTVLEYATDLLNFDPTGVFPGSGEQGVTGIAVDPTTGDVLASMLYASASNPDVRLPKIVRFRSTDGGRTASSQQTVLDMPNEQQGQSHQIATLTITPGLELLCHMGDGFTPGTPLDLDSFRGKILRMNLDGSAPSSNPFYDAGDGIGARDYVLAYGLRNPFGGGWRAADGRQYVVENGPQVDRFAQVVPGRNFGFDGTDASMANFAIHNWSPAHAPVGLAFVQPETFGGSGFPSSSLGHAFVGETGSTYATGPQARGKRISEWILDANGDLVAGPIPFLEYAGDGKATACGLAAGPDGLYMTELYPDQGTDPTQPGARLIRIHYDPADDCNGNGVEDACDVASGTSADGDGDWIPDECAASTIEFCFGDGTGAPCPCNNPGLPNHGCDNHGSSTGGARLVATGIASLSSDELTLSVGGENTSALTVFWTGRTLVSPTGIVHGAGLRCVGGLDRLYVGVASGGAIARPGPMDPSVSARTAAAGAPIAPGELRYYFTVYRDPQAAGACGSSSATVNLSHAVGVQWAP